MKPGHKTISCGGRSKVSTLPRAVRDEINRRLDENQSSPEIAAWLNAQEEVRKVLDEKWQGLPVIKSNIDAWRRVEYPGWLRRREHLENLKELSDYALKLGQTAGGSIADGSAAIVGGKIMAALETAAGDDLHKMVRSIAQLRSGDLDKSRLELNRRTLAQRDQKLDLDRKRYQRQTAELFLQWYDDRKTRDIVESRDSNAQKIEQLGRAIFGEDW